MNVGCTIKTLPPRLHSLASEVAVRINPDNLMGVHPQRIGLLTTNYWGPTPRVLSVEFMEPTPTDLALRILSHMNAWGCCVTFALSGVSMAAVRISRGGGGYWSYLGTDIVHVPANLPTMNLEGFTMQTPDSEFFRVVRHETGHTLGFPHEHMRRDLVARIDPMKAEQYFGITQGWSPRMVSEQVLTPLDETSIYGTPADQTSIMCYQLPGSITVDGQPIVGGLDINPNDAALARIIYPLPNNQIMPDDEEDAAPMAPLLAASHAEDHWSPDMDVAIDAAMWA